MAESQALLTGTSIFSYQGLKTPMTFFLGAERGFGGQKRAEAKTRGSGVAITRHASASESISVASGPETAVVPATSGDGCMDTRECVGLSPKMPQYVAGILIDPPPSQPSATGT